MRYRYNRLQKPRKKKLRGWKRKSLVEGYILPPPILEVAKAYIEDLFRTSPFTVMLYKMQRERAN